jgi:ABC-type enterochelin transport system ATPase subunit
VVNHRLAPLHEAVRNASAAGSDIARLYATLKRQRLASARITVEALVAFGRFPAISTSAPPPASCGR